MVLCMNQISSFIYATLNFWTVFNFVSNTLYVAKRTSWNKILVDKETVTNYASLNRLAMGTTEMFTKKKKKKKIVQIWL
jgi:hypothetical protein